MIFWGVTLDISGSNTKEHPDSPRFSCTIRGTVSNYLDSTVKRCKVASCIGDCLSFTSGDF